MIKKLIPIKIKKKIQLWFNKKRLIKRAKKKPDVINKSLKLSSSIETCELLICTINGLIFLNKKQSKLLLKGSFYGLTKIKNRWFVFERIIEKYGYTGRLLSFKIEKGKLKECKIEFTNLDDDIHQIDFYKNILYLTDTKNNRLLRFQIEDEKIVKPLKPFYPLGDLDHGVKSENYGHINSVLIQNSQIILICHNQTQKTKKLSEVLILSMDGELLKKINTKNSCAHNYMILNGDELICDSIAKGLRVDNTNLIKLGKFTRGLCNDQKYLYVGGSQIAGRENRGNPKMEGSIYILDIAKYKLKHEIPLKGFGNVYEIRTNHKNDKSLSANNKRDEVL